MKNLHEVELQSPFEFKIANEAGMVNWAVLNGVHLTNASSDAGSGRGL